MSLTGAELEEKAQEALSGVFSDQGTMLNRFVLVAEIIEGDGSRAVWTCTSSDLMKWDALGLLDYAKVIELTDASDEDDEED